MEAASHPTAVAPGAQDPLPLLRRPWFKAAVWAAFGAAVGGSYAHFVGCKTGTCLITSNVWIASIYGAAVGGLVGWPSRRAARG